MRKLLVLVLTLLFTTSAFAQDELLPDYLQDAIIVGDFSSLGTISVESGEKITYRLSQCGDLTEICFITVQAGLQNAPAFKDLERNSSIQARSGATLVCGYELRNAFGALLAKIENRQPTTFYNQFGKSPFSWDHLPTEVYEAYSGYSWHPTITTVNPAPGAQSNAGESNVRADLKQFGIYIDTYAALIYFTAPVGSSWGCLAGA